MTLVNESPADVRQDLEQLTALFRLLADRTRLQILMLLRFGERNVSSLCEALSVPQPTVSHHLGLLRTHNIIASRRSGKQVFYGLDGCVLIGAEGRSLTITLGPHSIHLQADDPALREEEPVV